jgi:hypothetical protein
MTTDDVKEETPIAAKKSMMLVKEVSNEEDNGISDDIEKFFESNVPGKGYEKKPKKMTLVVTNENGQ